MSLLSDLSIVIPTYNRPKFVLRTIRYWEDYNVIVHILDGSEIAIQESVISTFGPNIHYHHLPVGLMDRLKKSISLINTRYSMMMSDDEFFIPSAIESCIKELKKNSEVVSCMGSAISFIYEDNKIVAKEIYSSINSHLVNQETPLERATYHMAEYTPSSIYSVMKSEAWKKSIHALSFRNFEVYVKAIGEIQFEITSSYLGKNKIINELMWLRSFENSPIRSHESNITAPIQDFWHEESNKSIRDQIISSMVNSISSNEENEKTVSANIELVVGVYIDNLPRKSLKHRIFLRIFPKIFVSMILRLIDKKYRNIQPYLSIKNVISILNKKNIYVDIDSINKIEKVILSFYKDKSLSNITTEDLKE